MIDNKNSAFKNTNASPLWAVFVQCLSRMADALNLNLSALYFPDNIALSNNMDFINTCLFRLYQLTAPHIGDQHMEFVDGMLVLPERNHKLVAPVCKLNKETGTPASDPFWNQRMPIIIDMNNDQMFFMTKLFSMFGYIFVYDPKNVFGVCSAYPREQIASLKSSRIEEFKKLFADAIQLSNSSYKYQRTFADMPVQFTHRKPDDEFIIQPEADTRLDLNIIDTVNALLEQLGVILTEDTNGDYILKVLPEGAVTPDNMGAIDLEDIFSSIVTTGKMAGGENICIRAYLEALSSDNLEPELEDFHILDQANMHLLMALRLFAITKCSTSISAGYHLGDTTFVSGWTTQI